MAFPSFPFTCTLKEMAHARSSTGADWGLVSRQYPVGTKFNAIGILNNRVRINNPKWDGTKDFYVDQIYVIVYIEPPTEPPVPNMPPPEVAFRWRDSAGNITIEQIYIKKPL